MQCEGGKWIGAMLSEESNPSRTSLSNVDKRAEGYLFRTYPSFSTYYQRGPTYGGRSRASAQYAPFQ
jgi:hypothetical protein